MQVESIALSRDVPAILSWLINPLVRRVSRQSLASLLYATRRGLVSLTSDGSVWPLAFSWHRSRTGNGDGE